MKMLRLFAPVLLLLIPGAASAATGAHIPDPDYFQAPVLHFILSAEVLLAIGFLGQILFSARVISQAWASRQRGESYMPPSYWIYSLAAALLLIFYCYVRSEPVGLLMQALMSGVYMRNIYFIRRETQGRQFHRRLAIGSAAAITGACLFFLFATLIPENRVVANVANPHSFKLPLLGYIVPAAPVLAFGFFGSAIFMSRFLVQWLASERAQRSVVPTSFWILASAGSIMLLLYFIVRSDPVQLVGQVTTLPAYLFNLTLIRKKHLENGHGAQALPAAAEAGDVKT